MAKEPTTKNNVKICYDVIVKKNDTVEKDIGYFSNTTTNHTWKETQGTEQNRLYAVT